MQTIGAEIERLIDADLRAEWDIALGWFDVLAALQREGGSARPSELAVAMRLVPSSLSRRVDHLEAEGWIRRVAGVDPHDHRTVHLELTRRGRQLWREMNVTYRRSVQRHFAALLSDDQIVALHAALERIAPD